MLLSPTINNRRKLYLEQSFLNELISVSIPFTGDILATDKIINSLLRILYLLIKESCFFDGENSIVFTPRGTKDIWFFFLKKFHHVLVLQKYMRR